MIDQMRIANLAESTQLAYLFEIERLAKHYGTSPTDLDREQLRNWVLKLINRVSTRPRPTPRSPTSCMDAPVRARGL